MLPFFVFFPLCKFPLKFMVHFSTRRFSFLLIYRHVFYIPYSPWLVLEITTILSACHSSVNFVFCILYWTGIFNLDVIYFSDILLWGLCKTNCLLFFYKNYIIYYIDFRIVFFTLGLESIWSPCVCLVVYCSHMVILLRVVVTFCSLWCSISLFVLWSSCYFVTIAC
jgi:hypothetical protein